MTDQPHVPVALTRYPWNRRLGGPQRWCGRIWGRNVYCPCRDMLPRTDRCLSTSGSCVQKSVNNNQIVFMYLRHVSAWWITIKQLSYMWRWELPKVTYLKCKFQVNRCYRNGETRNYVYVCVCGGVGVHHTSFSANKINIVSPIMPKYFRCVDLWWFILKP